MPDIYGEDILCRISLVRIFCDEVDSPAEGGPHMVFVSTDEGVRYSDGSLLETTASQADKVTMMIMVMMKTIGKGWMTSSIFHNDLFRRP